MERGLTRGAKIGAWLTAISFLLVIGVFSSLWAQQPQIPTLQVCNPTKVTGKAYVKIDSRKDAAHNGTFSVIIDPNNPIRCDASGYPAGSFKIVGLSMSDSALQGDIAVTSIEQVTTTGKHTPTVYLNGRCKAEKLEGGRIWMMLVDNKKPKDKGTPDIISFLIFDKTGKRMAYGTGPVVEGDITVEGTGL